MRISQVLRPWRIASCTAATGIRCVKPFERGGVAVLEIIRHRLLEAQELRHAVSPESSYCEHIVCDTNGVEVRARCQCCDRCLLCRI